MQEQLETPMSLMQVQEEQVQEQLEIRLRGIEERLSAEVAQNVGFKERIIALEERLQGLEERLLQEQRAPSEASVWLAPMGPPIKAVPFKAAPEMLTAASYIIGRSMPQTWCAPKKTPAGAALAAARLARRAPAAARRAGGLHGIGGLRTLPTWPRAS